MIESISPTYTAPKANAQQVEDSASKAGDVERVNGVEVREASENKGSENNTQGHDKPPSENSQTQASLSLNTVVTAQSEKSNTSQPSKSTYEAAQQAETKPPSYTNIDA